MFDTHVTVVGNVLHQPETRRTAKGALVTTFKIASTARRLDRESGRWVDGNSFRVRVTCWRALATNVTQSVTVGDPLVVSGRLFTRDWEDDQGVKRLSYELEALAVGHDLSRGRAVFERVKPRSSTSVVEDADGEHMVGGEMTDLVPDDEAPAQFDDRPFDAVRDELAAASPPEGGEERVTAAGAPSVTAGSGGGTETAELSPVGDASSQEEPDAQPGPAVRRRRGAGRSPVPA
jgi:single-strand DNA-binding protein